MPNNEDSRTTEEQRKFAEALVSGASMYDAYVVAYMDGSTPERTVSNYTKKQIQNRAQAMKSSKGVRRLLQKGIIDKDIETAGKLVWDRRKATDAIMKAQKRAEDYLDKLEQVTQQMQMNSVPDYAVYKFGVEMLSRCSDILLKTAQELNKMYGISMPEVLNQNAVTVVFGSSESLPKDRDLEGFEEVEE